MKKAIIILISILLLLTAIAYLYINNLKNLETITKKHNNEYEDYYLKEISGTDLISLINKVIDYNEKNDVQKQENGVYISNEENSIHIYINFLESENIILMENIARQQTENFVKYYGTAIFECSKIEYYNKTNYIKNMYFEQISN